MLYIKDGYPEVGEIVLCVVKKIYGNTVFVVLEEYDKEGVLTISEIAPGRIRNLRDYVVENKAIVCKVLRVDESQKRIDVSLRRVPIPVMRDKLEEVKKEEYADRIYQDVGKIIGIGKDELFEKTYEPIFEEYATVFEALYAIMLDNKKVEMFTDISNEVKNVFIKVINERIRPEEVVLKNQFELSSLDSDGIDIIKSTIDKAIKELDYERVKVSYLAAGKFEIKIIHDDLQSADKLYSKFVSFLEQESKALGLYFKCKDSKK